MPGIRRRTIEQATLTVPAASALAAQNWAVTPVAEEWAPRKTTWNNQPALRTGQAVTRAVPATAIGARVSLDVTAFVQTVADGTKNFGLCIPTDSAATNKVTAFNDPDDPSWVLSIDFIEAPEPPTDLAPNGNVV